MTISCFSLSLLGFVSELYLSLLLGMSCTFEDSIFSEKDLEPDLMESQITLFWMTIEYFFPFRPKNSTEEPIEEMEGKSDISSIFAMTIGRLWQHIIFIIVPRFFFQVQLE